MFSSLEMFRKTEQDKEVDARYKAQIEEIDKAFKTIDEQWLSGKIVLNDLIWVLADGKQKDRNAYISPIIQSAITSKVLTIWNESSSVKLNNQAIHTKELPRKAFVLKQDFLNWLQQEQSVQLPQRLIDLTTIATTQTSDTTSEPTKDVKASPNMKVLDKIKTKSSFNGERIDPVKEAMQSLITAKPTITKVEMWAKLQGMARANTPPFIDEKDEHTLVFTTGGNAKTDTKNLSRAAADTRYDRMKKTKNPR